MDLLFQGIRFDLFCLLSSGHQKTARVLLKAGHRNVNGKVLFFVS